MFYHLPKSVFALRKDSKYKSHLVSGILTGLGRRVYIKNRKERTTDNEDWDLGTLIHTLVAYLDFLSEGRLEPKWKGPWMPGSSVWISFSCSSDI